MRAFLPWPSALRRKLRYAEQDVNQLLQQLHVDTSRLDSDASGLALHYFDNTEYETRLAQEWIPKDTSSMGFISVPLFQHYALLCMFHDSIPFCMTDPLVSIFRYVKFVHSRG